MEANQITFELRYFMRETQMFACFQSLAIKKNVWNCTTSGKEIELSKTMWRFWSGCHVLTKGEEVGPLGHKKFVSINDTSQGSWKTSALDIEPGMRDHEKRNCAGFNVKEENYWRAILLSPFPSLQFDKSLDELSGFRKNVEQTSLVPISLLWFWSSSSFWHGQGRTMLATIEDKWGSIRRKASQEQPLTRMFGSERLIPFYRGKKSRKNEPRSCMPQIRARWPEEKACALLNSGGGVSTQKPKMRSR